MDLEVAHGLIAVHGPGGTVRDTLAVELVTNRWSDLMRVTLVDFGDGVENISPERVRVAASLDDVPPSLAERAGLGGPGRDRRTGQAAARAPSASPDRDTRHPASLAPAPGQEETDLSERAATAAGPRHGARPR